MAGLACAKRLSEMGISVEIFEAACRIGGRVGTDEVDGFLLDHGFQVLQTGYPAATDLFDYQSLNLRAFDSGALVQTESGRFDMVDPWRVPLKALKTLFNPIGSFADRWRLAKLRSDSVGQAIRQSSDQDCSIHELLQTRYQFSVDFIDRFLRPWISGMFFDEQLETSAEFFKFIFKTLAVANAAVPSGGMCQLAKQLAEGLPPESIHLNSPVRELQNGEVGVVLEDGTMHEADYVVVATDGPSADALLARHHPSIAQTRSQFAGTATLYFAAPQSPPIGKYLLLNGELHGGHSIGPISNMTVPSNVSSDYAPAGQSLISVSVRPSIAKSFSNVNLKSLIDEVCKQAGRWFNASTVDSWRFIKHYNIQQAVPRLLPGFWNQHDSQSPRQSVFLCGDYLASPSLQGALESGCNVANKIVGMCHGRSEPQLCEAR